jgi:hypothetical protein
MRPALCRRLAGFGTTIFTEITRLANEHGAVNLGQGFPDFDGPDFVKDAAIAAIRAGHGQYARMIGIPLLNAALARKYAAAGLAYDAEREITVTSGDRSGDSTMKPAKGIRKNSIVTPRIDSRLPEKTWPATLAGGETSRRSSSAPTANMTAAPMISPIGSELPRKMGRNSGMHQATPMAARNPPNMAAPPSVGVGCSCTRRASGMTTAPRRIEARRTTGVRAHVTTAATARTIRYSAMRSTQNCTPDAVKAVFGASGSRQARPTTAVPGLGTVSRRPANRWIRTVLRLSKVSVTTAESRPLGAWWLTLIV